MIFPSILKDDHEARGEFYRSLAQSYLLHRAAGVPADAARAYAVTDTQEKINGFESWLSRPKTS